MKENLPHNQAVPSEAPMQPEAATPATAVEVGVDAPPVEERRVVLPAVTRAATLARNPSLAWERHVGTKPAEHMSGGPFFRDTSQGATHAYGTAVSVGRKRSGAPGNTSPSKNQIGDGGVS